MSAVIERGSMTRYIYAVLHGQLLLSDQIGKL